jgi:hypothetical protein
MSVVIQLIPNQSNRGWVGTNQSNIRKYPYFTSISMPSAYYNQATKQMSVGQIQLLDVLVVPPTVKQKVNGIVILPPLVFPGFDLLFDWFGLVCFVNKNKKMSVVIQLIPKQSNRRSTVQ